MVEPTQTIPAQRENDISLKELILKARDWVKYLWGKKLLIILLGLIGGGLGFTYAMLKKPVYVAELTFVLEDSRSSPLGTYAGLASQFGIDLSGASGSGLFSGDNILEFLRSRLMVEKTLLSPVAVGGKRQSLADLYIEMNDLRDSWNKTDRKGFSLQQDSVLDAIYNSIVKKNLAVKKPDKKLSFISVECRARSEVFSKAFTERLVKEATDFYVLTKTKRSKDAVDKLQAKADSIGLLLNRKTYSVAVSQDMNLNPAQSRAMVGTELESRDKMMLQTIYAEVIKNLEVTKMMMMQESPIIQVVDTPILPLQKERLGRIKGAAAGGFIAGLLAIVWLLFRRLYKEIMR
jgi:hypothetical protein